MSIIYAQKPAPFRTITDTRAALFLLAVGLLSLGATTELFAEELGRCPPVDEAPSQARSAEEYGELDSSGDASPTDGFRQKAAPFAPDLRLRVWYQKRTRDKDRARSHTLAQLARLDQNLNTTRVPYGWQVSLSWNLVDIADTLLPGDERSQRIYASDCAAFQPRSDALFELDEARESEAPPRDDERLQVQGDL